MLAVVQHNHRRGGGKQVGNRREGVDPGRLHHPEGRRYRPSDSFLVGPGGQGGKVSQGCRYSGQRPQGQPRLADATWSDQGHKPVLAELGTHVVEFDHRC